VVSQFSPEFWRARFTAEQWRVLNYIYQHKLHTVRPKMAEVLNSQKATENDLSELFDRNLIALTLFDGQNPTRGRVPAALHKHVRLRLTAAGLRAVLDDVNNQIRYALGQHTGPVTLAKLFTELEDSNAAYDYDGLIIQWGAGLLTLNHGEIGQFNETTIEVVRWLEPYDVLVALTGKGRSYLPR
jgi:hypothetical protein